jgi:glutathione S-transferase
LLKFYGHRFSSYCQKVLIALYENATPFEFRELDPDHPENAAEFARRWPLEQMPLLLDGDRAIHESSIVIEYLDLHYPGPARMIPADPKAALEARFMDRFFDNYISTPQQALVFNAIRKPEDRDAHGDRAARERLIDAYRWLDTRMRDREWASGGAFGLGDCSAAPALFYADWSHAIPSELKQVHAYRQRLLKRPSFARAVDEARPFRHFFPLGAPDRD